MRFIDCYAGEAGSAHDVCVLRRSLLHSEMSKESMFPRGTHIVGDAAYPLLPTLLVPYKDNGHLTPPQVLYNSAHSSIRCTIKRAFAQLKGRFCRLKYIDVDSIEQIPIVIMGCCVLHNLCINTGDAPDFVDCIVIEEAVPHVGDGPHQAGVTKRDSIANALSFRR